MSYYVYAYLRTEGYSPYYVGKGREGSWRHASKFHSVVLPKDKERITIIKEGLTNEEACELERLLILMWGRKDKGTGVLRNRTDGGEGTPGRVFSEETKEKIRQKALGRKSARKGVVLPQEVKDKVSKSRKGKGLSNTNATRHPCVVRGVSYSSKRAAARALGCYVRDLAKL